MRRAQSLADIIRTMAASSLPFFGPYGYQSGSFFIVTRSATILLVRQNLRIPAAPPEREPTPESL